MQKCEKCNAAFSWSKILKSYKWTYGLLKCDNCGTKHKITILSRFTVAVLTILPMYIFFYFLISFENLFALIGVAFLLATPGFLLSPFVVRYKAEL